MTDSELTVQPGHQKNLKRGPAQSGGTYIRDTPVDLKPGETVILRGGEPDPPPPPPSPPPPDDEPPPPPPPSGNRDGTSKVGDPFGLALMPVRAGMVVAAYTDFTEDGERRLGESFGAYLARIWKPREGMKDSAGQHNVAGIGGTYSAKNTWSQKGGIGDVFLHAHKPGQNPLAHDPAGTMFDVFTALDQQGDLAEGFVQWTEKMPTCEPFKQAPLWWPSQGKNENGEDDHAENKYGPGPRSNSFHHLFGGGQEAFKLNVVTTAPHVYGAYHRTKGTNGANDPGEFSVYVDGQLRKTFTNKCSTYPMHFNLQIETYLFNDAWWKATPRPPIQSGHVQFTKYRMDVAA